MREALAAAEYVVLQEAYGNTDTAAYADLLLPASGWGEKFGTVTNSERCITRVMPAVDAPGEARHDWEIVVDFARRLGRNLGNDGSAAVSRMPMPRRFSTSTAKRRAAAISISPVSAMPCSKLVTAAMAVPEGAAAGKRRLYEDGRFPTRWQGALCRDRASADCRCDLDRFADQPALGRLRDHWHGMSRTGTVPRLFNLEDEPVLAMHPCDMRHRGLESGDLVKVSNGRGEVAVRIAERAGLKKGRAWLPMHWGSQFMNSPGANALACDATDPYSRQPELKHAAVQIEKLDLPYPLAVVRSCETQPEALEMMQRARALLAAFPYATLGLYGRQRPLVVFRAAAATATDPAAIAALDRLFGMAGDEGAIVYADAARKVTKKAIALNGRLLGVRLAAKPWPKRGSNGRWPKTNSTPA